VSHPLQVTLTPEDDWRLQQVEQSPYLRPKVRLRATALRLSNRGWTSTQIGAYLGRSSESVRRDLKRWMTRGVEGLADGVAPGQAPRITTTMKAFLREKVSEERTWTAAQLADALDASYGVRVTPEAVRLHLKAMGYCWKRTRYLPCKAVDPEVEREHKASLETLKRGRATGA
jgi:transposase